VPPPRLLPALLAAALLAAHFLRQRQLPLMIAAALAPALLLIPRRWALRAAQLLLLVGAGVWLHALAYAAGARQEMGMPWARLAVILTALAALSAGAAALLDPPAAPDRYRAGPAPSWPPVLAFVLAALLLAVVQVKVPRPLLLAERFWPGAGWLEVLLLSTWAAFVTEQLLDVQRSAAWRRGIWTLFSVVFFGQLVIGLLGVDRLLMSGKLHLPVPAVILGGPLYRGGGWFMPILFLATILVVGPAWCSYLCYLGAGDAQAARRRPVVRSGRWQPWLRGVTLIAVVAAALLLRALGVPGLIAAALAGGFGLVGVGLMVLWSRRTGTMTHCTYYCPLGLVATWLGKLSPHRLRITDACTACGACTARCRYDALSARDLAMHRPAPSCTLCGDCLGACRHGALQHACAGLGPDRSRGLFLGLVAALHAVFLGVARL
jgi:NAD-dependent dihydropyrimidine dehydrogenase PreA subunit